MSRWRAPHTMPEDGRPVICAYQWSEKDPVHVTVGHWRRDRQYPGVADYPDGCWLPCVGWLPMPDGAHEPHLPLDVKASLRP